MNESFVPSIDSLTTGNPSGKVNTAPQLADESLSGRQYRLALRGNSINPMIDAATPLLGMVMRVDGMNSQSMPEHLLRRW